MRAIKRKWCLDYFKLSILYTFLYIFHFSSAVTNADLGLPRTNHCAFSYNQSLYIFGGGTTINNNTNEIIITFDPTNWNTKAPTINNNSLSSSSNNIDFNNSNSKVKCGLTNSGKAIIVDEKVQVLDIATHTRLNLTYQGSQRAIDAFITNTAPIKDPAVVTFDDYLMIYGGEQSGTTLQSTFILDTRIKNLGIWYELSTNSSNATQSSSFIGNPPPPSANTTLIATSRWILHFRSVKINPVNYTMYIDLFDPFNFNWLGTPIAAFNISTDNVNPVSLDSPDTIMIIPTWTQQQEETINNDININNNNINTNTNNNIDITMMGVDNNNNNNNVTGFWILNVSSWSPTAKVHWQENPQNNSYHPVSGNSVTAIKNTDLIVFYGGNDVNQELLLFNTTSRSFENSSSLSWFEADNQNQNQNNHQHRNLLAILLGSILGGLAFLILLFILIWCCYIRKRRLRKQEFQSRSYEENHAKERMIPNEGMGADRLCERSNSVASRYLLSPIKSVLPLEIFKDEGGNAETSEKENQKVQPDEAIVKKQPTSRFREHFDMTSFTNLKRSNDVDQGPSSSQSR